jgi:hypothetical protein
MLEKILKLREKSYLIILSIHILKLKISGCDKYAKHREQGEFILVRASRE